MSSSNHGSESGAPSSNKSTRPNTNGPRLAPGGDAGGGGTKNNRNRRRKANKDKKTQPGGTPRQRGHQGAAAKQQYHHRNNHHSPLKKMNSRTPADMTVIVHRVDVWDIPAKAVDEKTCQKEHEQNRHHQHVAPYHFAPDVSCWIPQEESIDSSRTVAVIRAPRSLGEHELTTAANGDQSTRRWSVCETHVVDTSIPNPHPPEVVHDKYWAQRRRLFSRFDRGIQLDAEGWFSVTPQVIAHHVAARVGDLSNSTAFRRGLPGSEISHTRGIVVLDAFCGCGGNSIAFGKLPVELISLVISVDVDRDKLRMAAHNASLYDIPKDKIIFVECNTMYIMEHCYKNGEKIVNNKSSGGQKNGVPCAVESEMYAGYPIGGLELLPDRVDAVFMDPPWGGVDYGMLGKDGYDLEKHMKIRVGPGVDETDQAAVEDTGEAQDLECLVDSAAVSGVGDDFFDTFTPAPSSSKSNKSFTPSDSAADGEYINGLDLLKMAAGTTRSRLVIYDLPRNTNKTSLGRAALAAGYRGNMKLEEHYLNTRLKTVTAYLGADYSGILH